MKNCFVTGLLVASLACLLPMAPASAQQTPANIEDAVDEFAQLCMANQTGYYSDQSEARASCACSLGMAGGYFDEQDFIAYLVIMQELLKFEDFTTEAQYDAFIAAVAARGFSEETAIDLMLAAEELAALEETYCGAYW